MRPFATGASYARQQLACSFSPPDLFSIARSVGPTLCSRVFFFSHFPRWTCVCWHRLFPFNLQLLVHCLSRQHCDNLIMATRCIYYLPALLAGHCTIASATQPRRNHLDISIVVTSPAATETAVAVPLRLGPLCCLLLNCQPHSLGILANISAEQSLIRCNYVVI